LIRLAAGRLSLAPVVQPAKSNAPKTPKVRATLNLSGRKIPKSFEPKSRDFEPEGGGGGIAVNLAASF
jgi:hypothetical protein